MLLLRAARAAATVTSGARRKPGLLPVFVAGLSSSSGALSGGRRRKGQRRGEAKPQPQPLPAQSEVPSKKKSNARSAKDRKARPVEEAQGPPGQEIEFELVKLQPEKPKRVVKWRCATGCGACCKLDKGPEFPTPDEIFSDYPEHLELYKSMIGPDGWCNNYDKTNRTCNIYEDRPFFCRVEAWSQRFLTSSLACHAANSTGKPACLLLCYCLCICTLVLRDGELPAICSACVDNVKMVYGQDSAELGNFKRVIKEESKKHEESMKEVQLLDT